MNEVGSIVNDIKRKSRGRDVVFLFIHRTDNRVAHGLTHHALSIHDMKIWESLFPEWLPLLVLNDSLCSCLLVSKKKNIQKKDTLVFNFKINKLLFIYLKLGLAY